MSESRASEPAAFTDHLRSLATAFQGSRVLLTAAELDLFTVLHDEERSSEEVASAIGADLRATDRLLNALVALGLLEKRGDLFSNTPDGCRLLVRGRPGFMANLAHSAHLWETWSGLTDVVRSGRPAEPREVGGRGDEWLRAFIAAMHWRGAQAARAVAPLLDLEGVSRILDVGGGSGVFSMALLRARPGASAVVFDLPAVVPITLNYIRTEGFEARIEAVAGDYTIDDLPGGFDLVFMSAVVHSNPAEVNRQLVAKAARALNPGGRLAIVDWVMDPSRTAPLQGALFAINMLVGTDGGDTFTGAQMREWMEAAGLADVSCRDTPLGTGILTGRRP